MQEQTFGFDGYIVPDAYTRLSGVGWSESPWTAASKTIFYYDPAGGYLAGDIIHKEVSLLPEDKRDDYRELCTLFDKVQEMFKKKHGAYWEWRFIDAFASYDERPLYELEETEDGGVRWEKVSDDDTLEGGRLWNPIS